MPSQKEKPFITKRGKYDRLPANTCTISLALRTDLYQKLIDLSEEEDRSVSSLVRLAIKEMLARLKSK